MIDIEKVIDQVTGSMAISGFELIEEDKDRIRRFALDPEEVEAVIQDLVRKHTVSNDE